MSPIPSPFSTSKILVIFGCCWSIFWLPLYWLPCNSSPTPAFASWTEPPPCEPKWPSCQFSTTELSIWGGGLGGAWVFMNQLLTKLWSFGGLQGCFALLDMSWYLKCRPLKPSIFRIGLGSERWVGTLCRGTRTQSIWLDDIGCSKPLSGLNGSHETITHNQTASNQNSGNHLWSCWDVGLRQWRHDLKMGRVPSRCVARGPPGPRKRWPRRCETTLERFVAFQVDAS